MTHHRQRRAGFDHTVAATLTPPKTEEYRHLALEISFTGSYPLMIPGAVLVG